MDQNMNMGTPSPEKSNTGVMISITIIVLVLAFGAYYFFKQVPETNVAPIGAGAMVPPLPTAPQAPSTELVDIQRDLDATNLTNIGAELNNLAI